MTMQEYGWGARLENDGLSTTFRLWAPSQRTVSLQLDEKLLPMDREKDGWFSLGVEGVAVGASYFYRLEDGTRVPDPASQHPPDGVHGPSLICSNEFPWQTLQWRGRPWGEAVIYELHVGAFTAEGTFAAAMKHLPRLAGIGITAIEIMPLAQFPGRWGWGYDGVFQYAPHNSYGTPDDFRRFIDAAHQNGLMVFLDVVYNHFGPQGNFLPVYAPQFFREDEHTPWGAKIAFEKEAVRQYFIGNVLHWLENYRLDGLRLDAVNEISDDSDVHILQEMSEVVEARFGHRHVHLITENPSNGTDLLMDTGEGRRMFVADWNDDFHHALHVAVTGEATGFYEAFKDAPWRQVKQALAAGYLHTGKQTLNIDPAPSASLPPLAFVHFLQNHDQVGNRALGERLHTVLDAKVHRLLTEILILSPQIPLLFMGDDHLSHERFRFFADYDGDLARSIYENRFGEAENFGGYPNGSSPEDIKDPNDPTTFLSSKIDWQQAAEPENVAWTAFLQSLIAVRREHIVPMTQAASGYAGSIVSEDDMEVFIDWQLGDRLLRLRANACDTGRELTGELGELLYASEPTDPTHALSPWSAKVFSRPCFKISP